MLDVKRMVLGPVSTNAYLVADRGSRRAVVIDPAAAGQRIYQAAVQEDWKIQAIWLTHAHFDHFAGAGELLKALDDEQVRYGMHPDEMELWQMKGGAAAFGYDFDPGPAPGAAFEHGQSLILGETSFEVRLAPGHSAGHVMFYNAEAGMLFSGDVIFQRGIGRTDLPGGDHAALIASIREQVFSLPDQTVVYPGHGPETTVGEEKRSNPFLRR